MFAMLSRLVAPLLLLSAGHAAPQVSDADLEALAESLAACEEARDEGAGLEEARTELAEALAGLPDAQGHPLKQSAALGRALWLSRGYGKQKLRKGKVSEEVFAKELFGGEGLRFAYRVPKSYAPKNTSYPLILAIPDVDEKPADHLRDHWSSSALREGAIVISFEMPGDEAEWDRVMINGRPGGLSYVLCALRLAAERFAVDFERVYVAGRGKGVPAAVAAGNYSPQCFAGVVGMAGDSGGLGPDNYSNLPSLFVGASTEAKDFQREAREFGFDNCELEAEGNEASVWKWMEAHTRETHPTKVTLFVGKPFPTRSYWLRVSPIAPEAHATASIDREQNTISIESEGVSHVTLYLNDSLVDLDKPLKVLRNGSEDTRNVRRNLPTTLALIHDHTSDAASAYVAQEVYDMREGAAAAVIESVDSADEEYQERLAKALGDADMLWKLHLWCTDTRREWKAWAVLQKVIRVDRDHAEARAALGHEASGDYWFTTAEARQRFETSQDPEVAAARGYVLQNELWMHPGERSLASKGRVKDQESGLWLSAADRKRLADGWVRQDLQWIEPAEVDLADNWKWRVDDEWLDLRGANERHARIDSMWQLPGVDVTLHASVDRETALLARYHMTRALDDLRKVFGTEPMLPLKVTVLRDEEQYDRFAFGAPDGSRPAAHAGRLHVIHSACFAESLFPRTNGKPEFAGMGVCYWNALAPGGGAYGVHSARLAVGLSYIDALDPSPKAVRRVLSKGMHDGYYEAHEAEKELPQWLRYGGAVYAERFFHDDTVAADGNAWWARDWSLDNLRGREGMRPLAEVLAFELDPDAREDSLKLLIESGLVVAFMVDGGCAPVTAEHEKLKSSLRAGRLHAKHIKALEEVLLAHEEELRAFAAL